MNGQEFVTKLIQDTFQNSFDQERFIYFIKNLLNHIEDAPFIYRGNFIPDTYEQHISTLERIGKYQDPAGNKIDLLIVKLKKETSLERARTMQRNFIAWYLNGSRGGQLKDAALVAFVPPNLKDWRFSLVKMEYKLVQTDTGKVKTKEELTPAKRWSFLVGETESTHTAQSSLISILTEEENPTLKQLEEAFNIERVTKEFYEKYRTLYEGLAKELESNKTFQYEAVKNNIDPQNFAKKLLGQIVFLYFLQKKGWLGAKVGKKFNEGDKSFLRNLFKESETKQLNFFDEYLEPLFYNALNKKPNRSADFYRPEFQCQIPFLNGGLFDPEYPWQESNIYLENNIFSDILDVFDLFNFTVKEDEPLEKEVAVDPEMLGKVFENLLEAKDRKSKGTYYTPREIVHYMCEQSLMNLLATETGLDKEKLNLLIHFDQFMAQKMPKEKRLKAISMWEGEVKEIERAVDNIRIVDPACGSGAFLVGMMQEVVKLRKILKLFFKTSDLSDYQLKSKIIQNNLYGVDIDPSAVEIAKLRLWLSLVVDEEDIEQIKPLPNLDYKIMQGNSLIELLSPELLAKTTDAERSSLIDKLKIAKQEFAELTTLNEKKEKRQEINDLIRQIVSYDAEQKKKSLWDKLKQQRSKIKLFRDSSENLDFSDIEKKEIEKSSKELEKVQSLSASEHFEWHINFNEVFEEKGGFDVVIANPPYIENKKIPIGEKEQHRLLFESAYKLYDISILFIEQSFKLLKDHGQMIFITTNKFLASDYGIKIRKLLLENTTINQLIDVSHIRVFKEAAAFPVIIRYQKQIPQNTHHVRIYPRIEDVKQFETVNFDEEIVLQHDFSRNVTLVFNISGYLSLCLKIAQSAPQPLKLVSHKFVYRPFGFTDWGRLVDRLSDTAEDGLRFIGTPSVFKYHVDWKKKIKIGNNVVERKYLPYQQKFEKAFEELKTPNILIKEVSPDLTIAMSDGAYCHFTGIYSLKITDREYNIRYILSLLNSKLMNFFYKSYFGTIHLSGGWLKINSSYLESLPIKNIPLTEQQPLISLVDKILAITDSDDYLTDSIKQVKVKDYEDQIDQMVYKLYNLTSEEIKIVEGS